MSEELKNKLIIMDTYFFQKLSKDENGSMDSPLINYDSVKKVNFNLNVKSGLKIFHFSTMILF